MMKNTGWTLLSLLITLTIVAILSLATMPGFTHIIQQQDVNKARNQLLRWQGEQINYRLKNSQYAQQSALSVPDVPSYTFTVSKVSETTYQLTATRNEWLGDGCDELWVNQGGHYSPSSCWN